MQWTVRDIPPELDARVRELAKARGLSLNKAVIQVVNEALGGSYPPRKKRDLSKWIEKASKVNTEEDWKAMEEIWNELRRVDPEDWR